MTPEQQRIKIAKTCGYHEISDQNISCRKIGASGWQFMPDYLNDLNAMHEAEKVLPDLHLYRKFLYLVVLDDPTNTANEPAFATASQRAEAFLRTLGLWT